MEPVDPSLLEKANWWYDASWRGLLFFGVITAVAACATIAFTFVQYWSSSVREKDSDWRILAATTRAASAEEELIKFRRARVQIFRPAEAAFMQKISPFKGVKFDTGFDSGGETMHFVWALREALMKAGWQFVPWADGTALLRKTGPFISGHVGATNVEIHLHPQSAAALTPAADALVSALKDMGIDAAVETFNTHSTNIDAIHILVGPKG